MKQYMIDIILPEEMTPEFVALIPRQRAIVNKFMQDGKISAYSLSLDRQRLWIIANGANETDVRMMLMKFPLIAYMSPEIHELAFHNNMTLSFSQISLN